MATCRVCGCTDEDCSKCIEKTGHPCSWLEPDLCSACIGWTVQGLARDLAVKLEMTGVLLMLHDAGGALHLGCTAIDDPMVLPFVALAESINIGCERGLSGFNGIPREKAIAIARRAAKAKPQSYYAEPFEPHEWVVDAVMEAASVLPPIPAQCLHCGQAVEREAAREHVMTCEKSPAVQQLARLRPIIEQAELVARHWETQDGINGAELDRLRDLVFDRPDRAPSPSLVPGIPVHLQLNMAKVKGTIDKLRAERDALRRELADQYPIAITAREAVDEGRDPAVAFAELRTLIDNHAKQTDAAKLEYLPTRLRGGS